MKTTHSGGISYSNSFLEQMQEDVAELAKDYLKSGGRKEDVETLKQAVRVIRMIRADNEVENRE